MMQICSYSTGKRHQGGLTPPTQVTPDNAVLAAEGGGAIAFAATCNPEHEISPDVPCRTLTEDIGMLQ